MVSVKGLFGVLALFTSVCAFTEFQANPLQPRADCPPRLKQPLPSGVLCGKAGTVKSRTKLYPDRSTPTLAKCQSLCLNDAKCNVFLYNSTSHLCGRSKDPVQGFKANAASKLTFWNRQCFNTTCPTCPEGSELCGTATCHDLSSDNNNCLICGNRCNAQLGLSCYDSDCKCSDEVTSQDDLRYDNANCGKCGHECRGFLGLECYQGTCSCDDGTSETALNSDNNNCGECGNFCTTEYGTSCHQGVCSCADGTTEEELIYSNTNCGTCGNKCPRNKSCDGGECR